MKYGSSINCLSKVMTIVKGFLKTLPKSLTLTSTDDHDLETKGQPLRTFGINVHVHPYCACVFLTDGKTISAIVYFSHKLL